MALTILIQFVFRLIFGLALAMAVTSSRRVTTGFYRVHLWVALGLSTLAGLAAYFQDLAPDAMDGLPWNWVLFAAIASAVLSYLGAVLWLYEQPLPGKIALLTISAVALSGAALATPWEASSSTAWTALMMLDVVTGGLLLGATITAMFLGHWYLNTPTMQLDPLKRLVLLMAAAVVGRAVVAGVGLSLEMGHQTLGSTTLWFVLLRWLSGLVGVLILAIMTWQTLKIPNTQSATGILYVGVICCFLGELAAQLLSVETLYPV